MFCGMGEHEMGLTRHETGPCGIDVALVPLEFDCQGCDVVIDFSVSCDFTSQPPVVSVSHHCLKYLEVAAGAGEHMPEPDR
jgi:hypothetical protein